jgi:hypothetical protein
VIRKELATLRLLRGEFRQAVRGHISAAAKIEGRPAIVLAIKLVGLHIDCAIQG